MTSNLNMDNTLNKNTNRNQPVVLTKQDCLLKLLTKSGIHGLPYIGRRDLNWSERIFWLLTVLSATYYSINTCWNQWERFVNNPIVYALELTFNRQDFMYPATTLCADYLSPDASDELINDIWGINPKHVNKTTYYKKFLQTLNSLRFDTLHLLEPYEDNEDFNDLNFLDMLLQLKYSILLDQSQVSATTNISSYAAAITEVGLCSTNSQLYRFTNPYDKIKQLPVENAKVCQFMHECADKIFTTVKEDLLHIYFHNVYDVVAPYERGVVKRTSYPYSLLNIELLLSSTTADQEVRNLPVAYRKCRYPDENPLIYFDLYRPGLCQMECRIKYALDLCKCKPYFYAVGPTDNICDIKGMLCLWRKKWLQVAKCTCFPLCEEISYVSTIDREEKEDNMEFERGILIRLYLPKMGMKRRVIFSTDQLVMSFGGAVGLFLGASFMGVYSLIYILFDYFVDKFFDNYNKCKNQSKIDYRRPRHA